MGNKKRNPSSLHAKWNEGLGVSCLQHIKPTYTWKKRWGVPRDCCSRRRVMRKMKWALLWGRWLSKVIWQLEWSSESSPSNSLWAINSCFPASWHSSMKPEFLTSRAIYISTVNNGLLFSYSFIQVIIGKVCIMPFPVWLLFSFSRFGSFATCFAMSYCFIFSLKTHLIHYSSLIVLYLLLACLFNLLCLHLTMIFLSSWYL